MLHFKATILQETCMQEAVIFVYLKNPISNQDSNFSRGFGSGKKMRIGDSDDVMEGYAYCSAFGLGRKSLLG
ncbi:hypothetical protein QVD17_19391 [Tagetes erecta]|uniref:Uncharacterized protein n=1 Tax=Tagetes erecta TaxID=13708 RepID=A0AAD8KJD0_TARER|nr:hypothetical protein QVD17_19391 [Tagetes erecta]